MGRRRRQIAASLAAAGVDKEETGPLCPAARSAPRMGNELVEYEALPEDASMASHMAAGALAGIAEHTATFPIDSIKTRMQVLRPHPTATYRSVGHALSSIRATEGFRRLWRGVGSVVLGAGPAHALYFAAYERAKAALVQQASREPIAVGAAGVCATVIADTFMTPFDVVKQRMQVHGSVHRGVWSCARDILRREGLGGFFVSLPATLILNAPFHAIQFPVYESVRSLLVRGDDARQPRYSPLAHVVAGGVAGGTAAFCTTPIDVVKTTLQTRNLLDGRISGMREAIRVLLRERGPSAFLMGAVPRTLTFVPGTAICWSVYEYFKWILRE